MFEIALIMHAWRLGSARHLKAYSATTHISFLEKQSC